MIKFLAVLWHVCNIIKDDHTAYDHCFSHAVRRLKIKWSIGIWSKMGADHMIIDGCLASTAMDWASNHWISSTEELQELQVHRESLLPNGVSMCEPWRLKRPHWSQKDIDLELRRYKSHTIPWHAAQTSFLATHGLTNLELRYPSRYWWGHRNEHFQDQPALIPYHCRCCSGSTASCTAISGCPFGEGHRRAGWKPERIN